MQILQRPPVEISRLVVSVLVTATFMVALFAAPLSAARPLPAHASGSAALLDSPDQPDFGPNVFIFTPDMPLSQIQSTVNSIAATQISNQFGTQRFALLFKPGTYGSSTTPLNFQVGYYTAVAGLGLSPNDVVINGSIDVLNQCFGPHNCTALVNFWRSLSNLTINVHTGNLGCHSGTEFWAVSQAAPVRRVHVNGFASLMDFCTSPAFGSGGFIADSEFDGSTVLNGSQQQWIVRNSKLDGWTNGVWNQVFSGVVGAPAQCFPGHKPCGGPFTTLATSPVTREEPFLYVDAQGRYNVFVPAVQRNSAGTTWSAGPTPGSSIPIERFFIAKPTDSDREINEALDSGRNLILTPGVYELKHSIEVRHSHTIVLGLGFPTLVPENGIVSMKVTGVGDVLLSGMIFDAGPMTSPALLEFGREDHGRHRERNEDGRNEARNHDSRDDDDPASDPSAIQDVFFRIGGAAAGSATNSLVVNSDNVILDDIWGWRADHGNGVGWTVNTGDTGVIVNGDNVTAYGLFVEHYQKFEVIWNGNGGTVIFFQNEMPYDPPSQAAWMEAPGVNGWAAFKVSDEVTSFSGFGMGSYSFFDHGIDIFAANAYEVPANLPAGSLHDLLTIFLSTAGKGGILNVINNTGGSSTIANPDHPVTVVSFP